jgi:hypothetical protein
MMMKPMKRDISTANHMTAIDRLNKQYINMTHTGITNTQNRT